VRLDKRFRRQNQWYAPYRSLATTRSRLGSSLNVGALFGGGGGGVFGIQRLPVQRHFPSGETRGLKARPSATLVSSVH
jgi:hypothetical protein